MPTPTPDSATELILIRHGETAWNRELRFQGHADVPLNDMGHEQARRLGLRMAGETAQHIVSSDLLRAQQTAAPASLQLSLPVVTSASLREQHFGVVEGMRADEIQALHPRAWEEWLQFREDHAMPEGESAREIRDGRLGRLVRNPSYGGVTPHFWASCDAVCSPTEWRLISLLDCGKGEPGQVMHVSHGCAPARFRDVEVGVA